MTAAFQITRPCPRGWIARYLAVMGPGLVVMVIGGCVAVGFWPDLVALNVDVQAMNALLLPLVLGLLIALARRALPQAQRLRGAYCAAVIAVCAVTCAMGVFGAFSGVGLLD